MDGSERQRVRRDPDGARRRILEAATGEFAARGKEGARVEAIAAASGLNKAMLYYYYGSKDALYLAVLEAAYDRIRTAERSLLLDQAAPDAAIARLIEFTFDYFVANPDFPALLNIENMERARNLQRSERVQSMHSPFVGMIAAVLSRGEAAGMFRSGVDPVQLYISIAGLAYFYLSNAATLSTIFGRDLLDEAARAERLRHMQALVLGGIAA
jgi:AcrR family transcriptional regulator